ncbi:MAG: orotidine-5'-phosphate decarboxylase [Acidobacteriota bacterium]
MNQAIEKFERRAEAVNSLLCVGLDPELERIPAHFRRQEHPFFAFNRSIIEQTHLYAAAYKPNMAFFEARGIEGLRELELTMEYLRCEHPDVFTICDAKRGDIGNTNRGYAASIFDVMGFDAVTLHPYLGREALLPFLDRTDKASIVLCRTSNPGAGELQDLDCNGRPLWEVVARQVASQWNAAGNCMLVVGATYPEEMRRIRDVAPEIPFLVPGVGAQGGDVAAVVAAGLQARASGFAEPVSSSGPAGLLISSSRGILFSEDPATAARTLRDEINVAREAAGRARKGSTHAAS